MKNPRLIVLYQQMSELTKGKCGTECHDPRPNRCCERRYCDLTKRYAKAEWDVELTPTGHPEVPFMGPNGCIVEPHLRPLCTLHTCEINGLGYTKHPDWDEKYFALRDEINDAEFPES